MGTDVLEYIYLISFFLGLGFAVLSGLLSGVFSGHVGAHMDGGLHADAGVHADGGHGAGSEGNVHYTPLSPVSIALFVSTFGGTGLLLKKLGFGAALQLPAAAAAGIAVGGLASWIFYRFMSSVQASSHARAGEAIGTQAEVTVSIPNHGLGEIAYTLRGSRLTSPAQTVDGKELPARTAVKIVNQIGSAFIVQRIP